MFSRFFHNKAIVYARTLANGYLTYFSPTYLFLEGGLPDRYKVPEMGLFYLSLAPLLGIGLISLFKSKINSFKLLMIIFLLIAPLPGALTYEDSPNVQRSVLMIIPLIYVMASGLDVIIETLKKRKIVFFLGTIFFALVLGYEIT